MLHALARQARGGKYGLVLADRHGRKAVIVPSWLPMGAAVPAVYITDSADEAGQGMAIGRFRTLGDIGLMIGPIVIRIRSHPIPTSSFILHP